MVKIGIIGHGAEKFTPDTEAKAKILIREILKRADIFVSGRSPLGGIDVWAEEIAIEMKIPTDIKAPTEHSWHGRYGYKARNLDIARCSDEVHVIVVSEYPPDYKGQKFDECYHCHSSLHKKSGSCWTAKEAKKLGKTVEWHVIDGRQSVLSDVSDA